MWRRGRRGGGSAGGGRPAVIRARPEAGGRWRPWGEPPRRAAEEGKVRGKGVGGRCLGVVGAVAEGAAAGKGGVGGRREGRGAGGRRGWSGAAVAGEGGDEAG